jgi:hypothetical protein
MTVDGCGAGFVILKTAAQFLSQARIRRKWFTLRPRHNLTITNQEETMGSFSDSI